MRLFISVESGLSMKYVLEMEHICLWKVPLVHALPAFLCSFAIQYVPWKYCHDFEIALKSPKMHIMIDVGMTFLSRKRSAEVQHFSSDPSPSIRPSSPRWFKDTAVWSSHWDQNRRPQSVLVQTSFRRFSSRSHLHQQQQGWSVWGSLCLQSLWEGHQHLWCWNLLLWHSHKQTDTVWEWNSTHHW